MDIFHIKDYELWNKEKERLNSRLLPFDFFFLEREIWWAAVGINIGREIDGKNDNFERPVLVVKKIDEELLYAIPITSVQKAGDGFYSILYRGVSYTLSIQQMRTISSKRLLRLVRRIDEAEFREIVAKVTSFFAFEQNETPVAGGISMDVTEA